MGEEERACGGGGVGVEGEVERVRRQTQVLQDTSEQLLVIMTRQCSQQLTGVFSTIAKYSPGRWRGCDEEERGSTCPPPAWCHECQGAAWADPRRPHHEGEGEGGCGRRLWRRRRRGGGWRGEDSWGGTGPPPPLHQACHAHAHTHTHARTHVHTHPHTPKWRRWLPSPATVATLVLLLVLTLPSITEGCSSRSTPKPRPPSPTLRPNITFQTYACPPAYAAWYCLNAATCFTVKIGESILYNCECADGYMGQRCEFKDLDGSYLPTREKVMLETASIAGGATVACLLVFLMLLATYILVRRPADKTRLRELEVAGYGEHHLIAGYRGPRPIIVQAIAKPCVRSIEELSQVRVHPTNPVFYPIILREPCPPLVVPVMTAPAPRPGHPPS